MTDTKMEWVEDQVAQAYQNFVHDPWKQVFSLLRNVQPQEEFAKKLQSWMINEIHNLSEEQQTEFKSKMNEIIELPPIEYVINEIVHPILGTIKNIVWKSKTTWVVTFDSLVLFGCDEKGFSVQSPSFDEIKDLKFTKLQQFWNFIRKSPDRNMYLHPNLAEALDTDEHQKNHNVFRELKYVQRLSQQHKLSCQHPNKVFAAVDVVDKYETFEYRLWSIHDLIPQVDGEKCGCRNCCPTPDDLNKRNEPFSWSALILS